MSDGADREDASRDEAARGLRVAGAVTGLVGVGLAATTTVWPTKVLALRVPEVGDFTRGSEQWLWAWGRDVVHYVSNGLVFADDPGPEPVARLVLLVGVLVLAVLGLVRWLVVPGLRGELSAGVGLGVALGTVASSVVDRVSFDDRTIGLQPGLVSVTTTAGWLEVAAVVLLLASLAVLVVPHLAPRWTADLAGRLISMSARLPSWRAARTSSAAGERDAVPPAATRPVATLRDVGSPGSTHTPSVGFSDDGEDRPDPRRG